jgi:glycerophosphoryl diester phosphodiesterase
VLVLAHRGLPCPDRPENTASAVEVARAIGADGVEVDLRLSSDGVLVASHDPDLARVAGQPMLVCQTSYARLRALVLPGGHRLAGLPDLLDAVGDGRIVLELKRSQDPPLRTALALAGELRSQRRAGQAHDITVSSFDPALVAAVRGLGLPVRTALLGGRGTTTALLLRTAAAGGHDEAHPWREDLLRRRRTCTGPVVVPWTVQDAAHVRRVAALGAAAVITDDPAGVLSALGRGRARRTA